MALREVNPMRGLESTPPQETLQNVEIGIYNETDRLKAAVVWGPVGAEAVLAQLYPKDKSCFYEDMNVIKAREEAESFANTLESHNVAIASVRDRLADLLPEENVTREEILSALLHKAHVIKAEYPQVTLERAAERIFGKNAKPLNEMNSTELRRLYEVAPSLEQEVDDTIVRLLDMDIKRYGPQKALALNKRLCLDEEMPLGDSIYARDQMNVILDTQILSNMRYPIRRPEVSLYKQVYDTILTENTQTLAIPDTETFEGGDAYVHNGIVYVGVGFRTSLGAAKAIYEALRPQLEERSMKFAIVQDEDPSSRTGKDLMDFMHLDTFSNPIGDKEIAVCEEEAKYRRVKYFEMNGNEVQVVDTGKSFLDHLLETEDRVIIIPREEQQEFGCNFLALDKHTLLLPLDSNKTTIARLKAAGKEVISLDLYESTRGYGASHCMTGQLVRGK